jgi:hypothetical protein
LLHYKDMLAFKAAGVRLYDFGGWYAGDTDTDLLRINKFKEEFGGNVELRYNCERGVTLLGKCALTIKRVMSSLSSTAKRRATYTYRPHAVDQPPTNFT